MSEPWVKQALESALLVIDNAELVRGAGQHVQPVFEATPGKIRPSMLAGECQLQTLKRFRGHGPQPHVHWQAARQGQPDSNSNIVFARGFLGEGLIVAAFKAYAALTQEFEVLGCAPELVFEVDDYETHPDLMVLRKGSIELIQVKTPSIWSFERQAKSGDAAIMHKYQPQMVGEMVIGRKMGIEIERSWLLMYTWEGYGPGQNESGVRTIVIPLEYEPAMIGYVESQAQEIREDNARAEMGIWPKPVNPEEKYNKWPCSYCSFARTKSHLNQSICTENDRWEMPESQAQRLASVSSMATATTSGPKLTVLP